ncbi:MAG: acyloxyacyl hydrolase [Pseudomonadota bacterium]
MPAAAVDGIAVEYGDAHNLGVDLVRAAVQWDWKVRWLESGNWHVGGYWDVTVGRWINDEPARTHSGLWELGITPVLRLQQTTRSPISPYVEAGAGAHLISETSAAPDRRFSTAFQFGSHLGLGVRFGPRHAYDLSYRFQHLSNADIKKPNDGIDFHEVRLGYWF